MGIEIVFLLLPLAVLSGWWIGRKSAIKKQAGSSIGIPSDYLKGLNFLLNEQPDKAIEIFIQLLEVNTDTVETHLALGSLFRRRGEVDRAIRIHQNLIARPTLSQEQRAQALYDLGQDYMRAGLFDRAETLFSELIDSGPHTESALRQLIDIYQQEKDWAKAIETARRVEIKTGAKLSALIAHYYCEQAENLMKQGETSKALKMLKRAESEDNACPRISMLEGDINKQLGDFKAAIKAYRRLENQDADYLPEIIKPLQECYEAQGQTDDMQAYLQKVIQRNDSITIMLKLAEIIKQKQGELTSADFIAEHLKMKPSVRGMDKLIELNLEQSTQSVKDKLLVLKDVTEQLLKSKSKYNCHVCGFSGFTLHWQCPSCKKWGTIKPIQGVEGD
ncbi:Lipopolysaccharide assembly protein LapB [hydrothermal vent metagenome]|uniref:Lipopolysaccharide assembly protein LapB n=1 Tax=hydrothermal vent metagenome TaxID=652676 RepID=A0A3B0ZPE3_9ZZZZ